MTVPADTSTPEFPLSASETPGQSIHRQRISRASYQARQRRDRRVRLLVSTLPFVLFVVGLACISFGVFRYLEQESTISLFLENKSLAVSTDGSWRQTPVSAAATATASSSSPSSPTPAVPATVAPDASGRLVTPFFYVGQQIGLLRFPNLPLEVKAFQGDSEKELRQGAGHYTGSFLPGQNGNIVVAGHRTSYFRKFEYLKAGDPVLFETSYGTFTYRIREFKIISGSDTSVARPTTQEQLTLYTCYPFTYVGNAPKRYVVICDLVSQAVRT